MPISDLADALNDLDLSDFAPQPKRAANDRPSKAVTAKAAEAAGFKSREPKACGRNARKLCLRRFLMRLK